MLALWLALYNQFAVLREVAPDLPELVLAFLSLSWPVIDRFQ